jgi:hypothetical protein
MNRTIFFNWEQKGQLHVAKDPIEEEIRWIIRYNHQKSEFELNRVIGGISVVRTIYTGKKVDELKWKATAYRINDLVDMVFNAPYLLDKVRHEKIIQLLESLNDRRPEYPKDTVRGEESSPS